MLSVESEQPFALIRFLNPLMALDNRTRRVKGYSRSSTPPDPSSNPLFRQTMDGVYACGVFQALSASVLGKTGENTGPSYNICDSTTLLMCVHGYSVQDNST